MKNLFDRGIYRLFSAIILLVLISMPAHADKVSNVNDIKFPLSSWSEGLLYIAEHGEPKILPKDTVFDIDPYPENDSQTTNDELAYLLKIAKTERSDNNLKRIIYEHDGHYIYEIFVNEGLISPDNSKLISLLEKISEDQNYFILERKKHFSRPRPSQLSPELKLVLPNPGHPAYPSGHASQSYMVVLILSDFDPEHSDVYKQFAIDIAHRREIAGFHYPSDSVAGRKLAVDILAKLRENKEFEERYMLTKSEFIVSDKLPDDKEIEQTEHKD